MDWTDDELVTELERHAYNARIKDAYGWGAEYARGLTNGLAYGLAWSGRLTMQDAGRAINAGWERARAELKERGMEPEALAPSEAGVEALDLLARFVAMVNTNYEPETMEATGVVAHARRLLERAGAWPPSGELAEPEDVWTGSGTWAGWRLTTNHAMSSYGQPVLVAPDGTAYGPGDFH